MNAKAVQSEKTRLPPSFWLLLTGQTVSAVGDQVAMTAVPLLILHLTNSGAWLGGLLTAMTLPRLTLILVGGALADRYSPRIILVWADAVRLTTVAGAALLALGEMLNPTVLLVLLALFGAAEGVFLPNLKAVLPQIVERESLLRANSLVQVGLQSALLFGPLLAAVALLQGSPSLALLLDSATFLVSVMTLLPLRLGGRQGSSVPLPQSIRDGWQYLKETYAVRLLVLLGAVATIGYVGALGVGLPTYVKQTLGAPDAELAWAWTAAGIGGIVGGLGVAKLPRGFHKQSTYAGALLLQGLCIVAIAFAPTVIEVQMAMAFFGSVTALTMILYNTLLYTNSDPTMQGRLSGFSVMGSYGVQPLSFLIFGLLVSQAGGRLAVAIGGGVIAVVAIAGLLMVRGNDRKYRDDGLAIGQVGSSSR
jgi:MFS family permease